MNGDKPAVTIIVAARGDGRDHAVRLERSLASVRRQSLRGVELLVADAELPRNSALERAAGEFVIFLDSGNVLDRHAARSAVAAAQDSGADVVSGNIEQRFGNIEQRFGDIEQRPLFRRTAHYASVTECPELLHDTTIDNKLFRTRFVRQSELRFVGDGSASSLGFVLAAYLRAGAITVVPQRVVVQHAEPAPPDPRELLEVHRGLDRMVAAYGPAEIAVAKDVRFLEVDLPRYLLGLSVRDEQGSQLLLAALSDYLDTLHPQSFAQLTKPAQVAVFMVRQRDAAGAQSAVDYLERGHLLPAGMVESDGRVYWSQHHLDTDAGRAALDVTTLGFHELPLSQLSPSTRIDELEVRGGTAVLRGSTANPLGRIDTGDVQLAVAVSASAGGARAVRPARVRSHTGDHLDWEATLDLAAVAHPGWRGHREWAVELAITAGAETTTVPVLAAGEPGFVARPLLTRRRWYPFGGTLTTDVSAAGHLTLRLAATGPVARRAVRIGERLVPDPATREDAPDPTATPGVSTGSLRTKARVMRFLLVRLPQRPRSVVFESHLGLSYSDNPRYVFEELQRRAAGFDVVWSFADAAPPMPPGVRTVRRNSWRHFVALARARYWVDNQGLPQAIRKPARVTYLQTWHGSALKRMGEDTPAFRRLPPDRRERHRQAVARWDYFVARSEHDVRTLVPALHVRGEVLRTGYPRNDPLVQLRTAEDRARVRAELGLPQDHTLVLYAPTFRETYDAGLQDFQLPIDLDQLFEKLPDHRLLVRTHYLQRLRLPAATHAAVRDVSHHPDITPLLVAADVLVTDYSSVMFDFANTGRPMLFYVYDYDDYAHSERGVYWELAEKAPGPMVRTSDELIQALATMNTWRPDYEQRYRDFVAEFGEYDTGSAARQVVDRVFFGSAGGE